MIEMDGHQEVDVRMGLLGMLWGPKPWYFSDPEFKERVFDF